MRNILGFVVFLFSALSFSACEKKSDSGNAAKEIRVLSWSDYLVDDVVKSFEKESGNKVIIDYFASNEELLAKVQATIQGGAKGYDLIIPSDYMVGNMVKLGLLQNLDKTQLKFMGDFDPAFMAPEYDPKLEHAVPFAWGTTGVAVNTKFVKPEDIKNGISWKDIFENKKYAGKVTMLDDAKENLHSALLVMGKTWSKATSEDIKKAFDYLKSTKKNLRIYTSQTKQVMEADECWLCQTYSGDALQLMPTKPEIVYLIPKEGATIWTDNLAIPKNAANVTGAYSLMNKLLSAEGAKRFTETSFYPSPSAKAKALLDKSLVTNLAIYPTGEVFRKLSYLVERPADLQSIDRYWTELKSN